MKMNSEEAVILKTKQEYQEERAKANSDSTFELGTINGISISTEDIYKFYEFDERELGRGHFGVVYRAVLKNQREKEYAVKSIKKSKLKGDISGLRNELSMLRNLDHPNIIQFYEIYQDPERYYFVLELCSGGDVSSRLMKEKAGFSEAKTREIMFQALLAINYLHGCGVIHRDIKPDNFLFHDTSPDSTIKLTDFGISRKVVGREQLSSSVGTPYYVAPEVLSKVGYSFKVDLWAAGVMMYFLLTKIQPFQGIGTGDTYEKILRGVYSMTHDSLLRLSAEGADLLVKLMEKDPRKRLTAGQALMHAWFAPLYLRLEKEGKQMVNVDLLNSMRAFSTHSKLVKEMVRLLVMIHDDSREVRELVKAFLYIDVLGVGTIQASELVKAFTEVGESLDHKEASRLIEEIGFRTYRGLNYLEFVAASVDEGFYLKEQYLEEAFRRFDVNGDGFINSKDMKLTFGRFGMEITQKEIMEMINEMDENSDQKVSFDEFVRMMKGETKSNALSLKQSTIG